MALEEEMRTYDIELEWLLQDAGKYVLIHGGEVLGVFAAREDALTAGYERVGLESFLVKKIEAVETVHSFFIGF